MRTLGEMKIDEVGIYVLSHLSTGSKGQRPAHYLDYLKQYTGVITTLLFWEEQFQGVKRSRTYIY